MKNRSLYITIGAYILVSYFVVFLYGFEGKPFNSGANEKAKEWENPGKEYLKLKATKDKILDVQEVDDIEINKATGETTNKGVVKKYLYISDVKVPAKKEDFNGEKLDEDISRRTRNAQFYKKPIKKDVFGASEKQGEEWIGVFYSGDPFYQDPATAEWYQTEVATTTITAYDEQTATSTSEIILNFLGVRKSYAACGTSGDPCYGSTNDGVEYHEGSKATYTWQQYVTGDGPTFGVVNASTAYYMENNVTGSNFIIRRSMFPFDTSPIGAGSTVTAAGLFLACNTKYVGDNDGNDFTNVVQYTGSIPLVANKTYWTGFGTTGTTKGSADKDISSTWVCTSNNYNEHALDATGMSWVNVTGTTALGVRLGHDLNNHAVANDNYAYVFFSDNEGTTYDPKLVVTFTAGGGGAPEAPKKANLIIFE